MVKGGLGVAAAACLLVALVAVPWRGRGELLAGMPVYYSQRQGPAQLGFIGGAGVEGGQGNSDSIYGSHDDHSTYGVSGSGWQGPGNGEAPGDLWNPAVGQRYRQQAQVKAGMGQRQVQDVFAPLQPAARGGGQYPNVKLNMGDLPVPIGYDGDRDRIVPGSNIHMYEHGVPTTIPFDTTDYSPYVVPSYDDPNYIRRN